MKKRLLSLALMTIFVSLMALGSAAYFTAEGRATNVIVTGEVDLTLTEESKTGEVIKDTEGNFIGLRFEKVMPGQTLDKHPMVENTGSQPFWLRVKVTCSLKNQLQEELPLTIKLEEQQEIHMLTLNGLDTEGETACWKTNGDGWYYYFEPVTEGKKVDVFTSVTIAPQMDNRYQDADGQIDILAQAVQYKNNEHQEDVLSVLGWPEENAQ